MCSLEQTPMTVIVARWNADVSHERDELINELMQRYSQYREDQIASFVDLAIMIITDGHIALTEPGDPVEILRGTWTRIDGSDGIGVQTGMWRTHVRGPDVSVWTITGMEWIWRYAP